MKKIHYSWLICCGCFLLLFCTIGLSNSAFPVYQPFLISRGGLTNTQASTVITIRNLFGLLSMLVADKFIEKLGVRKGVVVAVLSEAVGFVFYSLGLGLVTWYVGAAFVGLSYGFGAMVPASIIINRWFRKQRATAMGICATGAGFASILCPPLITSLVMNRSLKTSLLLEACFIAVVAVLVFLIVRDQPSDLGLSPLGETAEGGKKRAFKETIGRKDMILVLIAMFFLGSVGFPGQQHLSVVYTSAGITAEKVSGLLSMFGIALMISKLLYGYVTDRIGVYRSGFILFTAMTLGFLFSCFVEKGGYSWAVASTVFCGLGLCVMTVGMTEISAGISSEADFASTVKKTQTIYMIGTLVFGTMPGMIADKTGSYTPAYYVFVAQCVISALLIQYVLRKTQTN